MSDRGMPSADGSPACPFVAFEDDREERSDQPDHRHRCFAEVEPAPRALAHQEAYCLSSAFPVCPVFQEWARREAAHARPGGSAGMPPPPLAASPGPGEEEVAWRERPDDTPVELRPQRNPKRDWAAPPPWAAGAAGAGSRLGAIDDADDLGSGFLAGRAREGQGLAGSAADRLARGADLGDDAGGGRADAAGREEGARRDPGRVVDDAPPPASSADRPARGAASDDPGRFGRDRGTDRPGRDAGEHPGSAADPELAGLVGGAGTARRSVSPDPLIRSRAMAEREAPHGDQWEADDGLDDEPRPSRSAPAGRRPTVSSTRDHTRDRERERERERERAGPHDGPAWERQRRYEAYPTIRTRAGLSGVQVPRVTLLFGALIIAAIALFFLPALLGVGGPDPTPTPSGASPTPAEPTTSPTPTPIPEPTPQVYVVKSGDTLSRIAREFGLTVDQLLEANADTITDPNRISVGDEIIIPTPPPDEVGGDSPAPSG